jgi:hypothetical protein
MVLGQEKGAISGRKINFVTKHLHILANMPNLVEII